MSARRAPLPDVAPHIGAIGEALLGPRNRATSTRTQWRFGKNTGSLSVTIAGPHKGRWREHADGSGGDAYALIQHVRRCGFREAALWARAFLGSSAPMPAREAPGAAPECREDRHRQDMGERQRRQAMAERLWREAVQPAGTLAEHYLCSRGLHLEPDAPLRFHPMAWRNPEFGPRGPAMFAMMTNPASSEPCGVHVTYLQPCGGKAEGGRPRIMIGCAGCIRLSHDADVVHGLGLAEGLETALSVMQGFGWRPVWAATSAGGIASFPVLPGIQCLTVFADTGDAGCEAARKCAGRWTEAGREVRICTPPRDDFNTMIQERVA